MSADYTMNTNHNGVIRIGRKGLKKFAFGEDGAPFEVDVVVAFQSWIAIDDEFRPVEEDNDGGRPIPVSNISAYHLAAVRFVQNLRGTNEPLVTTAEALDFIARLREQYDELARFFRPRLREERDSPDSSGVELRFLAEEP
jgi:hypothetical protein